VIDSGSTLSTSSRITIPGSSSGANTDLAHRERRVRVDQRRRFGTDGNRREGAAIDVERVPLRDGKTAITRRRSRADRSIASRSRPSCPEQRGAATDDVKERAGVRRALQLQTAGFNTESREVWSGCMGT
jgi:hypothetical protein